jgi:hypothetical protein
MINDGSAERQNYFVRYLTKTMKKPVETTDASNRKRQAMRHKNHICMSHGVNGSVIKISN